MIEYARVTSNVPASVLRDAQESRAAAAHFGVDCVQRDVITGQWRPVYRTARDRAARLAQLAAELGPTAADLRRARLAAIAIDLQVDQLRARRRSGRGMIDLPGTAKRRR